MHVVFCYQLPLLWSISLDAAEFAQKTAIRALNTNEIIAYSMVVLTAWWVSSRYTATMLRHAMLRAPIAQPDIDPTRLNASCLVRASYWLGHATVTT